MAVEAAEMVEAVEMVEVEAAAVVEVEVEVEAVEVEVEVAAVKGWSFRCYICNDDLLCVIYLFI